MSGSGLIPRCPERYARAAAEAEAAAEPATGATPQPQPTDEGAA